MKQVLTIMILAHCYQNGSYQIELAECKNPGNDELPYDVLRDIIERECLRGPNNAGT